jgi:hypothetical protein
VSNKIDKFLKDLQDDLRLQWFVATEAAMHDLRLLVLEEIERAETTPEQFADRLVELRAGIPRPAFMSFIEGDPTKTVLSLPHFIRLMACLGAQLKFNADGLDLKPSRTVAVQWRDQGKLD